MKPNAVDGVTEYAAATELPGLGQAATPDAVSCTSYLVTGASRAVATRRVVANDGTVWFYNDQSVNPDSVELSAGGVWDGDVVLSGRIASVSDSEIAEALMRAYRSAVRKHFARIRAFWVGPTARSLLDAGKRLTAAVKSPREYDLAPERPARGQGASGSPP